jgi:hypothetical protein
VDAHKFLIQFRDFLAPKLDLYEQAIYLHLIRHTRLEGKDEITIGMAPAARNGVFGIGRTGEAMSPAQCREKLKSLETKGCIKILASEHLGFRVHANLPDEIPGIIPPVIEAPLADLESMDFYAVPENRLLILEREGNRCFYCLRNIDAASSVMEHVVSAPVGNNSYRNIVAGCRTCNSRKGFSSAEDFLRTLYRESFIGPTEFEDRLSHLERLRSGELKPAVVRANQSL